LAKLNLSKRESEHIYIGEYLELFEVYKKYYNMEVMKEIFVDEKQDKQETEKLPDWYKPPKG